jgi:hypothetical protein
MSFISLSVSRATPARTTVSTLFQQLYIANRSSWRYLASFRALFPSIVLVTVFFSLLVFPISLCFRCHQVNLYTFTTRFVACKRYPPPLKYYPVSTQLITFLSASIKFIEFELGVVGSPLRTGNNCFGKLIVLLWSLLSLCFLSPKKMIDRMAGYRSRSSNRSSDRGIFEAADAEFDSTFHSTALVDNSLYYLYFILSTQPGVDEVSTSVVHYNLVLYNPCEKEKKSISIKPKERLRGKKVKIIE